MRFKTIAAIVIIFSVGIWFLTGRVMASPTADGWQIIRDTATSALKFLWYPTDGASPSSLTLAANGNVGIGTDSPTSRLQLVNGNFNILTGSAGFDVQGTSGRNLIGSTGHLKIAFDSNNNESDRIFSIGHNTLDFDSASTFLSILESGNVGIGNVTPTAKLDVVATGTPLNLTNDTPADSSGFIAALIRKKSTADPIGVGFVGTLAFGFETFTNDTIRYPSGIKAGWEIAQTNNTTDRDSFLSFHTTQDDVSGGTGGTERMRITSTGNVGIGTASPAMPLHIMSTATNQQLRISDTGTAGVNQGRLEIGYDAALSLGRLQAWKENGGGAMPLTLNPGGGNVGIGTATPGTLLQLSGGEPRISLFDTDSTISSTNPAWVVRGDNGGNFKIQTTPDYIAFTAQMTIMSSGNVGIGTTSPGYKLEVNGTAAKTGGGSWSSTSDSRIKTNIKTYPDALSKLIQLRGVNFNWINPSEHGGETGIQGGFIAQEVEKIFPQWVDNTNPQGPDAKLVENGEKIKSLTLPFEFDAVVVESIKEQQRQIDQQAKEIEELKQEIKDLKQNSR